MNMYLQICMYLNICCCKYKHIIYTNVYTCIYTHICISLYTYAPDSQLPLQCLKIDLWSPVPMHTQNGPQYDCIFLFCLIYSKWYVCTYICMCVCVDMCTYTFVHTHTFMCIRPRLRIYIRMHIPLCLSRYVNIQLENHAPS